MSILSTKVEIRSLGMLVIRGLEWWKAEVSTLVPPSLQEKLFGAAELLTLDMHEEFFVLRHFQGRTSSMLHEGRFGISGDNVESIPQEINDRFSRLRGYGVPLVLRIANEHVLQRRLSLPRASRRELLKLLSFEIERQSPLPADEILFDHRIEGWSGEGSRIDVLLRIVKRNQIDRAKEICLKLVGAPSAIAPLGDLPPCEDGLFDFSRHMEPRVLVRRSLVPTLFLLVLFLVGLNLQLFYSNREARISTMEARLAEIGPDVERALALSQQIDQAEQRLSFSQKRSDERLVVELLDELATTLPDDNWLQEMEYRRNEIRLRGRSSDAASLLRLFGESASFGEAAFRAPVMAGRDGEPDRFDLALSLRESRRP